MGINSDRLRDAGANFIYQYLGGIVREESRRAYLEVVERMIQDGAQGIILGCTEIEMLIKDGDASIPFFATAALNSIAAAERALS